MVEEYIAYSLPTLKVGLSTAFCCGSPPPSTSIAASSDVIGCSFSFFFASPTLFTLFRNVKCVQERKESLRKRQISKTKWRKDKHGREKKQRKNEKRGRLRVESSSFPSHYKESVHNKKQFVDSALLASPIPTLLEDGCRVVVTRRASATKQTSSLPKEKRKGMTR